MKKIKFYQVKNGFANAFQDDKIKVFLELFTRSKENEFCKEQFNLIVEKIDLERLHNLIMNKYEERKDFTFEENYYHLVNPVSETEEILKIYSDHLELEYKAKKSQFYEFLTIYFPSLYALDEIKEKINPLRLVKP